MRARGRGSAALPGPWAAACAEMLLTDPADRGGARGPGADPEQDRGTEPGGAAHRPEAGRGKDAGPRPRPRLPRDAAGRGPAGPPRAPAAAAARRRVRERLAARQPGRHRRILTLWPGP